MKHAFSQVFWIDLPVDLIEQAIFQPVGDIHRFYKMIGCIEPVEFLFQLYTDKVRVHTPVGIFFRNQVL